MKILLAALLALAAPATAQTPPAADDGRAIPIRTLGAAESAGTESLGFVYGVRELSDGRVLVNDAGARRVLLFDRDLRLARVVVDSAPGSGASYGRRPTGMIRYAGDSTLLVDLAVRAFLVIDPAGAIVRVMAAPRPDDLAFLWNPALGEPVFDARGRLIYRSWLLPNMRVDQGHPMAAPEIADSAPIVRADFDSRAIDTLAWVRIPKRRAQITQVANGISMVPIINPLTFLDDWAALPDGRIAILRGRDYHVDWIGADGARSSAPRMPFDFRRLTATEKEGIVDSTRRALQRQAAVAAGGGSMDAGTLAALALPVPQMATPHTMPTSTPMEPGEAPRERPGANAAPQVAEVVPADSLPDYLPPILRSGNMKVDAAGNIWVLPSTSARAGNGLLYDVIDHSGRIAYRVRLPAGRALQGFGADGAVYLTAHDGPTRLERARLR